MKLEDIAVATITWARTAHEEAVLVAALNALARAGLPVAVADRDGSEPFRHCLRNLPGFHLCATSATGLVPQVQASMAAADGFSRRFILYVEPDKEFFFTHRLHDFLRSVPSDDTLGVAIASRSADSLATFPPMQRYTERVMNELCAGIIGRDGDYWYGPFVLTRKLLPHIARLDRGVGWGWRHAAFAAAARDGLEVVHVIGDYPCPSTQRDEDGEERTHRMRQLSQNILGLIS